jgi:soluble P-type ATPase
MISLTIPGRDKLELVYLVLDYNGTLALDGFLLPKVADYLSKLSQDLQIHVVTADTFGLAAQGLAGLPVNLSILPGSHQSASKLAYVTELGVEKVAAIGNGLNDHQMLTASALGLAIIGPEGASQKSVAVADIICPDIQTALALLIHPLRLIATLRD